MDVVDGGGGLEGRGGGGLFGRGGPYIITCYHIILFILLIYYYIRMLFRVSGLLVFYY